MSELGEHPQGTDRDLAVRRLPGSSPRSPNNSPHWLAGCFTIAGIWMGTLILVGFVALLGNGANCFEENDCTEPPWAGAVAICLILIAIALTVFVLIRWRRREEVPPPPQPGFYPDPFDSTELRWWNGREWATTTIGGPSSTPEPETPSFLTDADRVVENLGAVVTTVESARVRRDREAVIAAASQLSANAERLKPYEGLSGKAQAALWIIGRSAETLVEATSQTTPDWDRVEEGSSFAESGVDQLRRALIP